MNPATKRHYFLSAGLIIPIFAWSLQLGLSYGLGSYWCDQKMLFHAISFLCLTLALGGLWVSWRAYKLGGGGALSQGVIGLALLFILLIIVSEFANFILEPCQ